MIPLSIILNMKHQMQNHYGEKVALEIVAHPHNRKSILELVDKGTYGLVAGMPVRFDICCPPERVFVKKVDTIH